MEAVYEFLSRMISWLLTSFRISNVIEILVLAVCIYYIILWFMKTKAWTLLKGLLIVGLIMMLATVFQMQVITAILQSAFSVGIIALIVLFQPELRRALESIGQKNFLQDVISFDDRAKEMHFSDKSMEEIIAATYDMAEVRTGALIVLENFVALGEYEKTGITLNAEISSQLLVQIFEKNTPLHDGAVLISHDRAVAATCYLPVSGNMMISKSLGTRHRAALGISEVTDSLTIIVSEETGHVSLALGGEIIRNVDQDTLRKYMRKVQNRPAPKNRKWFKNMKNHGGQKSNEDAEKNTAE
ncbi:MAG: diadenylate cyclase CdaA [Lachnospiraceae bacterium]|nr:diadenylate cyclase CdaA [Lachnospiraceae bacterium]